MGDTGWGLIYDLNRDDALKYLQTRADQGFNVIQAVLADGKTFNGAAPFNGGLEDPATTPGADPSDPSQYDYWDHVDWLVNEASSRGMRMALWPAWADGKVGSVLTTANAQAYGEFLGKRYGDDPVVWVLGGDWPADGQEDVWRALAKGIAIGTSGSEDYSKVIMSYHPRGDQTSATWFHNDEWLDFNMQQGGHCLRFNILFGLITGNYGQNPPKPFLDGEPLYEEHPYCWDQPPDGYSTAHDVRERAYWNVFGGAAGHTYGHHTVWQFLTPDRQPMLGGRGNWTDALTAPGATEMKYVRALVESRPFVTSEPDQSVLDGNEGNEGSGDRIEAVRAADGAYLMVYSPFGEPLTVNLNSLSGTSVHTYWYDPRTGNVTDNGVSAKAAAAKFTPPSNGADNDWVLVADDASRGFSPPGQRPAAAGQAPSGQPGATAGPTAPATPSTPSVPAPAAAGAPAAPPAAPPGGPYPTASRPSRR